MLGCHITKQGRMTQRKEINESDLFQYMGHELSAPKRDEVEAWINASEENRKVAEDYHELFLAVTSLRLIKRSAPRKALEKVDRQIRRNRVGRTYSLFQRIAAVLLLPLLCLSGYLLFRSGGQEPVFYMETHMTPGMTGSTFLPDGTKVWLNSSSSLKYPSRFIGESREVTLDGEAYFEVTGNAEKPFIVHSGNSSVKVLGTQFNIDAYSSSPFITTTLVEGAVEFRSPSVNGVLRTTRIKPDEQIYFDKKTMQTRVSQAYTAKDIAWKEGKIILKETSLSEILWILSKRFNVEFTVKNPAFYNYSFTGVFTNQQIERVLEHFKRSSGIHYTINYDPEGEEKGARTRIELY